MAEEEEWTEYDGGPVQEWHRNASRIRVASDVAVIPERAFELCEDLTVVDLGNVTTISDYAFWDCSSLDRVVWTTAYSAVTIGISAFCGCKKMEEIDLSNVTEIGQRAFEKCEALTDVAIPSSAAEVDGDAFRSCKNLADVELGEGVGRIGKRAFYDCSALVRINFPASVTNIEEQAFYECSSLTEVELNEGLQRIGESAFHSCTSLHRINIPSTTVNVGRYAFRHCHQLRHAELQEGLQIIGEGAFKNCYLLERITVPSSTIRIQEEAFGYCNNLSEVSLLEGGHCIDSVVFYQCPLLKHINIPPVAFVIYVERRHCYVMRSAMPTVISADMQGETTLVLSSKWMQNRRPNQLSHAHHKVNEILHHRGELTEEEKIASIRGLFAYLDMLDVTTMLELAIWNVNMNGDEPDAEVRQARRRICGSDINVIIPAVLPFLEMQIVPPLMPE